MSYSLLLVKHEEAVLKGTARLAPGHVDGVPGQEGLDVSGTELADSDVFEPGCSSLLPEEGLGAEHQASSPMNRPLLNSLAAAFIDLEDW